MDNFKTFKRGDRVKKRKGSEWQGRIVGWYSTSLTPEGYAVESGSISSRIGADLSGCGFRVC